MKMRQLRLLAFHIKFFRIQYSYTSCIQLPGILKSTFPKKFSSLGTIVYLVTIIILYVPSWLIMTSWWRANYIIPLTPEWWTIVPNFMFVPAIVSEEL